MIKVTKKAKIGLSIVVPIYNEEKILEKNAKVLEDFIKKLNVDYEIILSENGSTDATKDICKKLAKNKKIKYLISKYPSFGHSIRRGVMLATKEYTLVFPIDLWGLSYIEESLKHIQNYDVIFGSRYLKKSRQKRSPLRIFISVCHTKLINILFGTKFTDIDGVKMYKTEICKKIFQKTKAKSPFIEVEIGLIIKNARLRFLELPIIHIEPKTRHVKYVIKMTIDGIKGLILNYVRLTKLTINKE